MLVNSTLATSLTSVAAPMLARAEANPSMSAITTIPGTTFTLTQIVSGVVKGTVITRDPTVVMDFFPTADPAAGGGGSVITVTQTVTHGGEATTPIVVTPTTTTSVTSLEPPPPPPTVTPTTTSVTSPEPPHPPAGGDGGGSVVTVTQTVTHGVGEAPTPSIVTPITTTIVTTFKPPPPPPPIVTFPDTALPIGPGPQKGAPNPVDPLSGVSSFKTSTLTSNSTSPSTSTTSVWTQPPQVTLYPNADPPSCIVLHAGPFHHRYRIRVYDMPDVPGYCGRMWDEIHWHDPPCHWLYYVHCEEPYPNVMDMRFEVWNACSPACVESAWWETTHNEHGGFTCTLYNTLPQDKKRFWHAWDGKDFLG